MYTVYLHASSIATDNANIIHLLTFSKKSSNCLLLLFVWLQDIGAKRGHSLFKGGDIV